LTSFPFPPVALALDQPSVPGMRLPLVSVRVARSSCDAFVVWPAVSLSYCVFYLMRRDLLATVLLTLLRCFDSARRSRFRVRHPACAPHGVQRVHVLAASLTFTRQLSCTFSAADHLLLRVLLGGQSVPLPALSAVQPRSRHFARWCQAVTPAPMQCSFAEFECPCSAEVPAWARQFPRLAPQMPCSGCSSVS
jgi:hypothetical protein